MDRRARHEAVGGFGYGGKLGGHFVRFGHGAAAPAFLEKGGFDGLGGSREGWGIKITLKRREKGKENAEVKKNQPLIGFQPSLAPLF